MSEEALLKAAHGVEDYPTPGVRYTYVRKETTGRKKSVEIYCYTIQVDSIASPKSATVRNVDQCRRKDQSAKLESGLRRRSVIQPGATGGGVAIGHYCYLQLEARDVTVTFYHGVPVDG